MWIKLYRSPDGDDNGGGTDTVVDTTGQTGTTTDSITTTGTTQTTTQPTYPVERWTEMLPEDIRQHPNITRYATPDKLAKAHIEAIKKISERGLTVPREDAPQEEKDRFYSTLGRPEKPDGYQLAIPEKLHPSIQVTPEVEGAYKDISYKLGLTQAQANGLNQWYLQNVSQATVNQEKQQQEEAETAGAQLRQEWGKDYDTNVALSSRLLKRFGGDKMFEHFNNKGLGRDPQMIKFLAQVGRALSEDSIEKMGVSSLTTSAHDAKQRIKQIESSSAYMDENDPTHAEIIKERTRLYEIAYGEDT